jgi:CheY-like chemotaxis protein/tRNA A-37 threonylcarbamoyl transferase component Bud32
MASILLVDDDEEAAEIALDCLRLDKHSVEVVYSGRAGLELALTNKHDLLILDWDIPDLNGISILRRFREGGGRAPVIMLTGHSSSADKELGLDTGADDYVTKPFDVTEFAARVRAALRRAASQAPVYKALGTNNEEVLKKGDLMGTALASRYEFLELLGEGGSGMVFKAKHPLLNKSVAIKMLRAGNTEQEAVERFKREAEAVSRLDHPNILVLHDFGITENGQTFMVTEFIEGINLSELLLQVGALSVDFSLGICMQVCEGMAHAHAMSILHRDIKPSNIMLKQYPDRPPVPKLLDFGLAKFKHPDSRTSVELTRMGQVFGSPPYMSPEQVGGKPVDTRSDIYSLGCVLYAMLTSVPPHLGDNGQQIMLKHVQEEVAPLCNMRPDLEFPEALEQVIQKALHKDLEKRYQSMSAFRDDLAQIKSQLETAVNNS